MKTYMNEPELTNIETLHECLRGWLRWFRLRRAVFWAGRGLSIGLGISIVASTVLVLRSSLIRAEYIALILAVSGLGTGLAVLGAYLWPMSRLRTSRLFDLKFGLRERISTALEIAASEDGFEAEIGIIHQASKQRRNSGDLMQQQLQDAIEAAQGIDPRKFLPPQIAWRELLIALGLILGAYLLGTNADHFFQSALQARAIQSAIREEISAVEALRADIEQDESLSPEGRQALLEPLNRLQQELANSQSLEQAVSALTTAEEEMTALNSPQSQSAAKSLRQTGQRLSQGDDSPLKSLGESLTDQDFQSAAQELNSINLDQLPETERAALSDQLSQAADSLAPDNPQLSKALQDASRAVDAGDVPSAQQALRKASAALSQTGQRIAQSQLAAQTGSQLAQGTQRLAQAGSSDQGQIAQSNQAQNSGTGQGNGQNQNPGRALRPGSGQAQGQGSSSQSGQGNGSTGAGQGTGGGDSPPGPEADEDPISQDNLPGDGGERPYEQIYPPQRIGGTGGIEVALPRSEESGAQVLGQGNVAPGQPGPSRVPYTDVLPAFEQAYHQAIEGEQIPAALRPVIRDYFSALEP
jgi:hypothetical protein